MISCDTALLSAEDERVLARQIEAGVLAEHLLATGERPLVATDDELAAVVEEGRRAWQRFWLANVRLVWKLAGAEARRSGLGTDELFQEGCLALAGALQRFDPDRGRFTTYAMTRIRQHLLEVGASRLGQLPMPTSRAVRARRARGVEARLSQELRRSVEVAEVARELAAGIAGTAALLAEHTPTSLDDSEQHQPMAAESEAEVVEAELLGAQVRRLLAHLPSTEAVVVRQRYGLDGQPPRGLAELATGLRVSVSTIRRWEQRGLRRLRALLDADPWLGAAG